jgi:MFS family permease
VNGRLTTVALGSAGVALVAVVAAFLYIEGGSNFQLFAIVTVLALAGGAAAAAFVVTGAPEAAPTDREGRAPHPGITLHAIPIAGTIGGVSVLGYLVMFWFGAPGWRPLVVGLAAMGVLLGAALILRKNRRAAVPPDEKQLHLEP